MLKNIRVKKCGALERGHGVRRSPDVTPETSRARPSGTKGYDWLVSGTPAKIDRLLANSQLTPHQIGSTIAKNDEMKKIFFSTFCC